MQLMIRSAIILMLALYLTPSEIIETLQIRTYTNILFATACSLLLALSVASIKRYSAPFSTLEKVIAVACTSITILIGLICMSKGSFYIEGYKFFTIFMLIFVGHEISRSADAHKIINDVNFFLFLYVIGLSLIVIIAGQEELLKEKGAGGHYTRLDFTGSVTLMAVTSALAALSAIHSIRKEKKIVNITWKIAALLSAMYLILLAASRQSILIFLLYAVIIFSFGGWRKIGDFYQKLRIIGLLISGVVSFFLFSIFINDSLYIRIFENPSGDYTSGRLSSISMWLDEMNNRGGALGFGYVRNNTVQEIEFLWPHNEFFRFYIEGGILGLLIIILLLGYVLFTLRLALTSQNHIEIRYFMVAITSVMLVELNLDNFIHDIYGSSFYFLLLSIFANKLIFDKRGRRYSLNLLGIRLSRNSLLKGNV